MIFSWKRKSRMFLMEMEGFLGRVEDDGKVSIRIPNGGWVHHKAETAILGKAHAEVFIAAELKRMKALEVEGKQMLQHAVDVQREKDIQHDIEVMTRAKALFWGYLHTDAEDQAMTMASMRDQPTNVISLLLMSWINEPRIYGSCLAMNEEDFNDFFDYYIDKVIRGMP